MWEGKTREATTLRSRNTVVTVDVYPKGSGMIYFNFTAPVYSAWNLTTDSNNKILSSPTDRFVISWTTLGADPATTGTNINEAVLNDDADEFVVNTVKDKKPLVLTAGTYLFTIKQQTYNSDDKVYEDISGRKQVLIVDSMSGMDTVIAGSLDSTSYQVFNYEAGAAGDKYGIYVDFVESDTSQVGEFAASVYNGSGIKQLSASKGSHQAEGTEGEVLSIRWTSVSDMQIYVNGDPIKTSGSDFLTTGTNGYLQRNDGIETLIKTSGTDCLLATVVKDKDYIVSLVYKEGDSRQSVSFTVGFATAPVTFTGNARFSIQTANASKNWDGELYYNIGDGWTKWDGKSITSKAPDYSISFRGTGNQIITGKELNHSFYLTYKDASLKSVKASGSVSSLFDYKKDPKQITIKDYALARIFQDYQYSQWSNYLTEIPDFNLVNLSKHCYEGACCNCRNVTTPSDLPATKLAESCYASMYASCSGLIYAPELPVTELKNSCYYYMFSYCSNLANAPELPATTMVDSCYAGMFAGCSKFTTIPDLPATTLATSCYAEMFKKCTSLVSVPTLRATTLAPSCYSGMFSECTKLVNAPTMAAMEMADSCCAGMFKGCTALQITPALPAPILANCCYHSMFADCIKLVTATDLPATTLKESCYENMFYFCKALVSPPKLPATTLAKTCYKVMFQGCTAIKVAPELNATTLAKSCYCSMFSGCTSLTTVSDLPALTLSEGCYEAMFGSCYSLENAPAILATACESGSATQCRNMFVNCTSLKKPPILNLTTLTDSCFDSMFWGCSNLKVNNDGSSGTKFFTCNNDAYRCVDNMFYNTGGTFTGTPSVGVSYYYY